MNENEIMLQNLILLGSIDNINAIEKYIDETNAHRINGIKQLLTFYSITINDNTLLDDEHKQTVRNYMLTTLQSTILELMQLNNYDAINNKFTTIFFEFLDGKEHYHKNNISKSENICELFIDLDIMTESTMQHLSDNHELNKLHFINDVRNTYRYHDPINEYVKRYYNQTDYTDKDTQIGQTEMILQEKNEISHKYINDYNMTLIIYLYVRNSILNNYN